MEARTYACIDMRTFYASVECAQRGLNPFSAPLVVADPERGPNALCLAVSPYLKVRGVKNRCRLSDIPKDLSFQIAPPRMRLYMEYAAEIYALYLRYMAPEDMHVYSIDESFLDLTEYLRLYRTGARDYVRFLMQAILDELHIPSTAGIGTNLYLAKVALDLEAKHNRDHIAFLDEEQYRARLWHHRPLSDFWSVAQGTQTRLAGRGIFDMEGVAHAPQELLARLFGKDWILLYDHAWGREDCRMEDIKAYRPQEKSISNSQILPRDYTPAEGETVLRGMVFSGCERMAAGHVSAGRVWVCVGFSDLNRPPVSGQAGMSVTTNLPSLIEPYALRLYRGMVRPDFPVRRIGLSFGGLCGEGSEGYDLFVDPEQAQREKSRQRAVLFLQERYGRNAVLRGTDYLPEATRRERNGLIGGHKA